MIMVRNTGYVTFFTVKYLRIAVIAILSLNMRIRCSLSINTALIKLRSHSFFINSISMLKVLSRNTKEDIRAALLNNR